MTGSQMLALLAVPALIVLLVWFFFDTRFYVYAADIQGNAMLSRDEVFRASGLDGMSIFYVDRARVAKQIREGIPGVTQVYVNCHWPNQVSIRIGEQDVRFVWQTRGAPFLVDGEGLVLRLDDGSHKDSLVIHDLDDRLIKPGDKVDLPALNAVLGLHGLLPEVKLFEYSREKGVSLMDARGWRIYFGDDRDLDRKVANLQAMLQQLVTSNTAVELIDLRFADSPYYK